MKLVDKYILGILLKNFTLITFLFLFLGLLTRVFHYSSLVTEENGSLLDLLLILALIQAKIFTVLSPFTLLIASFITYNGLIHANEHIAMYNAGISETGIVKPFFYISSILFIIVIIFSSIIVPFSYKKMNEIHKEIGAKLSNSIVKPKQFIDQKGILMFINEASQDKIANGIIIMDERDPEKKTIIISNQGKIGFDGAKILFDAEKTYVSRKTDFSPIPLISNFEDYRISFFIKNFINLESSSDSIISNKELLSKLLNKDASSVKEFKVRFGWAFFIIIMPFGVVVYLLKFFNFTRSRLNITHIIISFGILLYISLSGLVGELIFNSSVEYLFLYYINIFLIFGFLLFKLRLKNFV